MGLLENLDASIEALMPPEQARKHREARIAEEANRAKLRKTIIRECAESIEYASLAIQSQFGETDIQAAIEHLQTALAAARELER